MSSATIFLSKTGHRIMRGHRGGFYIIKGGKKVYGIKAYYRKAGGGRIMRVVNHLVVPVPIRRSVLISGPRKRSNATSTNFLTKSGHRIMHSEKGAFFINKEGKRMYKVKAHKRKVGNSSPTNIANHLAVPSAIRKV